MSEGTVSRYVVPKEDLPKGIKEKIIYGARAGEKAERTLHFAVRKCELADGRPYNRYWGE